MVHFVAKRKHTRHANVIIAVQFLNSFTRNASPPSYATLKCRLIIPLFVKYPRRHCFWIIPTMFTLCHLIASSLLYAFLYSVRRRGLPLTILGYTLQQSGSPACQQNNTIDQHYTKQTYKKKRKKKPTNKKKQFALASIKYLLSSIHIL